MDEKATYRKGLEDGIEQGKNEEKIQIAKRLLKKGLSKKEISEITGLDEDVIS